VREVEAADGGGWEHREILGELDACCARGIEQGEQRRFLRVIWRGWVARCGADAAISLAQQVVDSQLLVAAEAPGVANLLVQPFGAGLGQAVGERFGHDGVVIVMLLFEFCGQLSRADSAVTANAPR